MSKKSKPPKQQRLTVKPPSYRNSVLYEGYGVETANRGNLQPQYLLNKQRSNHVVNINTPNGSGPSQKAMRLADKISRKHGNKYVRGVQTTSGTLALMTNKSELPTAIATVAREQMNMKYGARRKRETEKLVNHPLFAKMVRDKQIKVLPDGSQIPYRQIFYGHEKPLDHQLPDMSEVAKNHATDNVFQTLHNQVIKIGTAQPKQPYTISRSTAMSKDPRLLAQDLNITRNTMQNLRHIGI